MTVFVISDLHLFHQNVLAFERLDGKLLRPFRNLAEMHANIILGWCSVVTDDDKVYVLGDVAKKKIAQPLLASLPGKKRLVRGNHDHFKDSWYHAAGFETIYGVRQINGIWLTHIPMHPQCLAGRVRGNIHGHMHSDVVRLERMTDEGQYSERYFEDDPRYFNACVEQVNYTPVAINAIIEERGWGDPI